MITLPYPVSHIFVDMRVNALLDPQPPPSASTRLRFYLHTGCLSTFGPGVRAGGPDDSAAAVLKVPPDVILDWPGSDCQIFKLKWTWLEVLR